MGEQITNYKCPACTGPLHFNSGLGKLKCDYCESVFDVAEIESLYKAQDEAAAKKFDAAHPEKAGGAAGKTAEPSAEEKAAELSAEEIKRRSESKWQASGGQGEWNGGGAEKMGAYNCPSCGAELICDELTAASSCPYCGNPTIVPGQLSGALKPDYIIPFKLNKEQAKGALKNYYKKKRFLPKAFKVENQIEKLQGLYVPFWFYDGEATAQCYFEGTTTHSHRQGDYIVTRTKHYDIRRFGNVKFERIPADASSKMPDDLMDSIEPYNYAELTAFSAAYLPGYMADKYDISIEENAPRVDKRATNSAEAIMRADVGVYDSIRTVKSDVYIKRGKVHYAFLPVWIINTKWKEKRYLFAMNGQTGKFVGELPVDGGKLALFAALVFAATTALCYFCHIGDFFMAIIEEFLG